MYAFRKPNIRLTRPKLTHTYDYWKSPSEERPSMSSWEDVVKKRRGSFGRTGKDKNRIGKTGRKVV